MPVADSSIPIVLAVDPDPATSRLIALYLEPHQYEVRVFPSLEALFPLRNPDRVVLLLINAEMIRESNAPALGRLHEELGGVPIIALHDPGDGLALPGREGSRGGGGTEERTGSILAVIHGHLAKPLQAEALMATLNHQTLHGGGADMAHDPNASDLPAANPSGRLSGLEALIEEMEMEDELIAELVDSFLERGENYINDLQTSLDGNDANALERTAHTMKGMAGNLRFAALVELNERVRALAKSGDLSRMQGAIDEIRSEFNQLREAIRGRWKAAV